MKKLKAVAALCLMILSLNSEAKQFKTISSREGLSNNAILSMHQDNKGHLYLGTMDGLNIWNGNTIEIFSSADGKNIFFGNKIRHIIPGSDEKLYLLTTYGLAVLDIQTRNVAFFENMAFSDIMTVTEDGNIFSVNNYNKLQYLDTKTSELRTFPGPVIEENEECRRMFMMKDGRLCIMTSNSTYLISFDNALSPAIRKVESLAIPCLYVAPRYDDSNYLLITADRRMCSFNIEDGTLETKAEIDSPFPGNDDVTGIIPTDSTYLIGFRESGVKILEKGQKHLVDTDIDCRVLSMIPDKKQPIIWIGTDCNGLIRWSSSATDITCITYDDLPYSINTPVRSIYLDNDGDLWFGTKGDGLFRIRDFREKGEFDIDKFCEENSNLVHNSIYTITESNHPWIWIGSDGDGLNYYSYKSGRLGIAEGSKGLSNIHCVLEQDGETLWVSTDGQGCYRCRFTSENGVPHMTDLQQVKFSEPFNDRTSIFSMTMENDSTIWFGSRGSGVLTYNVNSGKSKVIQFPADNGYAINETFFITKSKHILIATGNGLVAYAPDNGVFHRSEFVPQKATHGIVCDKDKNIWVSTNSGIISLDSAYNYRLSFDRFSGLDVLEYADGACYYDESSDKILFGGINGLTIIDSSINTVQDSGYVPDINITDFIQNGKHLPIEPMMNNGKLKVPYSKSIFGIKFSVVDHLHLSDYRFMYSIEGYSSDWIANDNDIVYLPSLNPGRYELKIKYVNHATQYESAVRILPIHIMPPLYRSWWAYCLYALFIGLTIFLTIKLYMQKYAAMQERIRRKYSDEIIKTTSETTNAINEELSVQLTFIIGLCQQIRQATQNNPLVANKVNLVEYNIAKINKTLHIFNEYKDITEALISAGQITLVPVSQTITGILELMGSNTKLRGVTMNYYIEDDITIAINKEAFLTMLYSLIYKVISTTSDEKKVVVNVGREGNGDLAIRINFSSNRKHYDKISSSILTGTDVNFEKEYDIVLCHQLIAKMNGKMILGFNEETGNISVTVLLPSSKIENGKNPEYNPSSESINTYNTNISIELPKNFKSDAHPDYICIISKNRDISSFLGYFLSDSYSIRSYTDSDAALEKMEQMQPIAVIYDVSSMHNTFNGFLESMKKDRRLGQVITVALTSSLQITEREEYTKLGADLCISFPFNMNYLRETLEQRIQKQKSTAEYYRSPISTYTINEGKYIHLEDKEFFDKVLKTINDNISNPDLTAPMIAELLGTSTRVMYRKLESITDKKLHQILRETRMNMAVSLLASSKHTIDEIMYKVGYDNRSTFHRNFKEIYGMTPREYREQVHNDMINNLKQ